MAVLFFIHLSIGNVANQIDGEVKAIHLVPPAGQARLVRFEAKTNQIYRMKKILNPT